MPESAGTGHETWILDESDPIIRKRAMGDSLTQQETMIYCLWVADYCMRNAGDLENAIDLYPALFEEAKAAASALSLPKTLELFAMDKTAIQRSYFRYFDEVCEELRTLKDFSNA